MSDCQGRISAKGKGTHIVPLKALSMALGAMMQDGKQNCAGRSCDEGTCTFGLTEEPTLVQGEPEGEGTTVIAHGEGMCFCVQ